MRAFIIRPFGIKKGVDFDKIEEQLILPALKQAGITGHTTGVILEAGNIRQDMFELLLTSDLVIADISIHNANVFYELGIRHALRKGSTILIRSRVEDVPFDLKTDRYLAYDIDKLQAGVQSLFETISETRRNNPVDSPVFRMLPSLKAQDPEVFLPLPEDFSRELEIALKSDDSGKLRLLATEVEGFPWAIPALRAIAEIQYQMGCYIDSKQSFEKIKDKLPSDIQTNDRLATIYHRLGELELKNNPDIGNELFAKSEQAIDLLFDKTAELSSDKIAEFYALRARNEKSKWLNKWIDEDTLNAVKTALRSIHLINAYENYLAGYYEDLNHYYSGINALALLKVIIELAKQEPNIWEANFDTELQAQEMLSRYSLEFDHLVILVKKAVEIQERKLKRLGNQDPWVIFTKADLAFLLDSNSERVHTLYSAAIELAKGFNLKSAKRQLDIFKKLQINSENVQAALTAFKENNSPEEKRKPHVILFTGHMIDADDRKTPRFPKEIEAKVKSEIKTKIKDVLRSIHKKDQFSDQELEGVIGIAGGACGGDIIYHEVCKEFCIKTKVMLALPRDQFIATSVSFAGNDWVNRFRSLEEDPNAQFKIFSDHKDFPNWLKSKESYYSFWERNNQWILNSAISLGGRNLTLIALWDGKKGDGPGGTQNMINEVEKIAAKAIIINPKELG